MVNKDNGTWQELKEQCTGLLIPSLNCNLTGIRALSKRFEIRNGISVINRRLL